MIELHISFPAPFTNAYRRQMAHTSKLIQGTKPEAETLLRIQQEYKVPAGKAMAFMVFETVFKEKTVYCCWSGGAIVDGEPQLTLVGRAAMEALVNLPFGSDDEILFQELRLGHTPLRDKVRATIMSARDGAKICFFGDMQGELDGHMAKALNLQPGTHDISH